MNNTFFIRPVIIAVIFTTIFAGCSEEKSSTYNTESLKSRDSKVITYPAPEGEDSFDMYSVKVNGKEVFVYTARVSRVPENQIWPGYQRPKDQTEIAGFAYWDQEGPARVEIKTTRPVEKVTVRPLSLGIKPKVSENTITFNLAGPAYPVVEVNDTHHALHLFVSKPEQFDVSKDDPDVIYFGPGVHNPRKIVLKDNQTVYIAGGAVVYGVINSDDSTNIKVIGRGILDASKIKRSEERTMLSFFGCKNVIASGIVLRDPHVWAAVPKHSENVLLENLKLIGCWRYNADGFDFVDSCNSKVSNCFLRTFDDALVVKSFNPDAPAKFNQNILFEDCVIWNDWGISLGITYETRAKKIRNITFRNCDVIHNIAARAVMTINPNDRGEISNVLYKDIRVEDARDGLIELIIRGTHWSTDSERGHIRNIRYENISVLDGPFPGSNFQGYDDEHMIEDVKIKDLNILGQKINNPEDGQFTINEYVENLTVE